MEAGFVNIPTHEVISKRSYETHEKQVNLRLLEAQIFGSIPLFDTHILCTLSRNIKNPGKKRRFTT